LESQQLNSKRPIGVLIVAGAALAFSAMWALALVNWWIPNDPDDNISTVWERGEAPIHIALLAVLTASALGLLWRRPHARIGLLCVLVTITAAIATSVFQQMTSARLEFPDLFGGTPMWVYVMQYAVWPALASAISALILYGKSSRKYFSEMQIA
jgi:hypothetical protein